MKEFKANNIIKNTRLTKGLTYTHINKETGLSRQYINAICCNRANISEAMFVKIMKSMGVPDEDILNHVKELLNLK